MIWIEKTNLESIKLIEEHILLFSSSLDQQIHGIDYDYQLEIYQTMIEDWNDLKKNSKYFILLNSSSLRKVLLERNTDYFLKKC